MTAGALQADRTSTRGTVSRGFRPDIQGLRAVAVGIVLVFHAGAPFLPGGFVGVDVFFVISGFLITGMLLRDSLETGRINLSDFYARRVRRILPAATIVLILTAIATVVVLPRTRWESIGLEIIGSAFYYVNWIFAANTDYLNSEVAPSPVQHFWTLAVEEQFYIVWPLLLVALLYLARPRSMRGRGHSTASASPTRVRRYVEMGVGLITVPSLVWSIYFTLVAPAPAYFVTTTRLWELGVGASVAVLAARFHRLPPIAGHLVAVAGLAAITAAAVFYTPATPFPGVAALLPTLGAAGVIIGGMNGREVRGVGAILSVRPMRWAGDISYSLYLWHWPMIVIGTFLLGGVLDLFQGILIVALSFLPAWASYRFVETPFRQWETAKHSVSRSLQLGLALMLASALAGLGILLLPPEITSQSPTTPTRGLGDENPSDQEALGGAALLATDRTAGWVVDEVDYFRPSAVDATSDYPPNFGQGCHQEENEVQFESCVFGDSSSNYVVALVGDSHAAHWLPALIPIARDNGWRLEIYTKSSCPLNSTPLKIRGERRYTECSDWNSAAMASLLDKRRPDHVVVSASVYVKADDTEDTVVDGYADSWKRLQKAGVPVSVLLGTPQPRTDIPECVSVNPTRLSACAIPRDVAMQNSSYSTLLEAANKAAATPIDLVPMICPEERCAPVIGSVLVYRDSNHMTATYATSLAVALEQAFRVNGTLRFAASP